MSRIAVLIVAAGKGERAGLGLPKQYESLAGTPVLRRTVRAFAPHPVQVVIGPGQDAMAAEALADMDLPPPVTGGATRQESVRLGLEALAKDAPDFVLIHDAARPFVSPDSIAAVIAALENGAGAALPMLAVADTLRRRDGDGFELVPREGLYRAQTPQGFRFNAILAAHRDFRAMPVTDDVALAEMAGLVVQAVPGDDRNFKLTPKEDFAMAGALPPALEVEKKTGSMCAKSFSACMRSIRTEPTMPRQPTRPTRGCCAFAISIVPFEEKTRKSGFLAPGSSSREGRDEAGCG